MENAKKPFYRYCLVPECKNTIVNSPDKVFFSVPRDAKIRKQWCKVMRRQKVSPTSPLYCCEDHFNIEEDTKNYVQYNIMKQQGERVILRLKEGVAPHIFQCRKRNKPPPQERVCAIKRERLSLINEPLTEFAVKSTNALESATPPSCYYEPGHSTFHIGGCDDYQMATDNQAEIKVCRVCLAVDVKMYDMKDYKLSEMYQNITGITACDENESIHRVCWECAARLTAAAAFRDKALLSDALLKDQVHMNKSDIARLKQTYLGSLKSPLTIQTVFTSYDNDCSDTTSENKETELFIDGKDANKSKTELKLIIEEEETDLKEEKPLIDFIIKTEVESDPIDENNFNIQSNDVKTETFSEITHFNDRFTSPPLDDCEDEIENTEVKITNNDEDFNFRELNETAPKNDCNFDTVSYVAEND